MKTDTTSAFGGTWLISFADLITLLLCAFLMFFSLNYRSGIPIADTTQQQHLDSGELTLWLHQNDLVIDGTKVNESTLEKLRKHVESVGYGKTTIELALCEQGVSGESTIGRLMSVGRQLIDIGITQDFVKYRLLGNDCSLLNENAVGLIQVQKI